MQAIDLLMEEHEVIHQVLSAMEEMARRAEAGAGVEPAHGRQLLEFLRMFADTCHHAKEEQHLFPALKRHGLTAESGPVAVMLQEHEQGRELTQQLEDVLGALERGEAAAPAQFARVAWAYVSLLRSHIAKENQVLFPMAAHLLNDAEAQALLDAFGTLEHEEIGAGVHEKYLAIADALATAYGVPVAEHSAACGCGHGCGCG